MAIDIGSGITIGPGIEISTGSIPDTYIATQLNEPLITENDYNLITES